MVHLEDSQEELDILKKLQDGIMKQYRLKKENIIDNVALRVYQQLKNASRYISIGADVGRFNSDIVIQKVSDEIPLDTVPLLSDFCKEYTGKIVHKEFGKSLETYEDIYRLRLYEYIESKLFIPALQVFYHNYLDDFKYLLDANSIEFSENIITMKDNMCSNEDFWFELTEIYAEILDEIESLETKSLYQKGKEQKEKAV